MFSHLEFFGFNEHIHLVDEYKQAQYQKSYKHNLELLNSFIVFVFKVRVSL